MAKVELSVTLILTLNMPEPSTRNSANPFKPSPSPSPSPHPNPETYPSPNRGPSPNPDTLRVCRGHVARCDGRGATALIQCVVVSKCAPLVQHALGADVYAVALVDDRFESNHGERTIDFVMLSFTLDFAAYIHERDGEGTRCR